MSYPQGPQGMGNPGQMPGQMPVPPMNCGGAYGYAVSPLDTLLAPARRAGITMFVAAALTLVLGGLFLWGASMVNTPAFKQTPQYQQMQTEMSRSGMTIGMLQFGLGVFAVACLLYAIVSGVLAFFVRKGGAGAVVTALVLTIIGVLLSGLMLIVALAGVNPEAICMTFLPTTVLIVQLVFLILATAKVGQVGQWRRYLEGQGWSAQWPQPGAYPQGPAYTYPGANPYSLPPAPPTQNPPPPPPQG